MITTSDYDVTTIIGTTENIIPEPAIETLQIGITKEASEQFSFVSTAIVTPIICALGLIANSLGIGVLLKATKQEQLSIYYYLCSLTITDTAFLFTGLIRSSPNVIRLFDKYLANKIEQFSNLGFIYVDMILTYSATYIIVTMAIERLMALVRPFSVKDSPLSKYPKAIVFGIFLLNAAFLCPFPINFEVASFQNMENRTEYYLRYKLYALEWMAEYEFIHTFVHNYIPGCILLGTNIAIPVNFALILKRRSSIRSSSNLSGQQIKITTAVFVVTLLYFLFSLPDSFIKTRAYFFTDYSFSGKYRLDFWFFVDVSNLFTYLNAANDFFVYILVSDHYRKLFTRMYCACVTETKPESSKTGTTEISEKSSTKY